MRDGDKNMNEAHNADCVTVEYTCSCEGCWACSGHEYNCTCDIDWDRARHDLTYRAPGRFGPVKYKDAWPDDINRMEGALARALELALPPLLNDGEV